MSDTLDELKKIISEQEAALMLKAQQQKLNLKEQLAFEKLQIRLMDEEGMQELPAVETLQKMYKSGLASFEIQSESDRSFAAIAANFERKYGKENIKNNNLCFEDHSRANVFFHSQANLGYAFLFKEAHSDNYAFSDGDNHYKMGTKAEIMDYCRTHAIKPSPFDKTLDVQDEHAPASRRIS